MIVNDALFLTTTSCGSVSHTCATIVSTLVEQLGCGERETATRYRDAVHVKNARVHDKQRDRREQPRISVNEPWFSVSYLRALSRHTQVRRNLKGHDAQCLSLSLCLCAASPTRLSTGLALSNPVMYITTTRLSSLRPQYRHERHTLFSFAPPTTSVAH